MNLWFLPSALAIALFAAMLTYVCVRRPPPPLWRVLCLLVVTGGLWCAGDLGSSFFARTPRWHFFWLAVEYVGVVGLSLSWWFLAWRVAESQGHGLTARLRRWLWAPVPVGVLLLLGMLTNPWHGQFLTPRVGEARSDFQWMFWVLAAWAYVLNLGVFAVCAWLRGRLKGAAPTTHVTLMMTAAALTLASNLGYVLWPEPPPFDPTVSALAVAIGLFLVGMHRTGLFGVLPVALAEITQHDPDGVVLAEAGGRVLYANGAAMSLFGPARLYVGADVFNLLAGCLLPAGETPAALERAQVAKALTAHQSGQDGQLYRFGRRWSRWLRVTSAPLPAHARGARVYMLRVREITAFKEAEDASGQQAAALAAILSSTQDGLLVVDRAGRTVYFNRVFQDMWGLRDDILEHGDDAALLARVCDQLVEPTPFLRRVQSFYAQPRGESRNELYVVDDRVLECTSRPLLHGGGPIGRVWIFREVTVQRAAAARVRHSRDLLQGVADATHQLLAIPDHAAAIGHMIATLGRTTGADRAYILQMGRHAETGEATYSVRHEWRTPGLAPRPADMPREDIPVSRFGFEALYTRLVQGEVVQLLTRELPPAQREYFTRLGPQSQLQVPIIIAGALWGVLGLDDHRTGRRWSQEEEAILTAMGASLAGSIERQEATERLRHQRDLLSGVTRATNQLLTTPDHGAAVRCALATLGEACGVNRTYIMRIHPHPDDRRPALSLTESWRSAETPPPPRSVPLHNLCIDDFGWDGWYATLQRGKAVGGPLHRLSDVPRDYFRALGIKSHLLVPIFVHDALWGIVGFDDCRSAREWSSEEEAILAAMAANIAGAIERAEAKAALIDSEARYRRLVENAPLGVIACDCTGRILALNEQIVEMMGSPSVEATLAINLLEFQPLVDAGVSGVIRQCLETGARQTAQISYTSAWDKTLELRIHVAAVVDQAGTITGAQALVEDVTDYRRAQAALLHAQKLESLGVLAGGIAHDFNNLLVGVMGNAGLALGEVDAAAPARHYLLAIEKAAEKASDLTRQLLAYAGKGKFVVEPLDLSDVVEEMTHLLDVSIAKNVRVQFDLDRDLPAVEGDPTQMRQIVMNLVINASDAIGEADGVVRIRTGCLSPVDLAAGGATLHGEPLGAGPYVYLQVCDTGCGMDADTQARIFDPFFTTKFTGRGLGLAGVLGIVRSHAGAMTVESSPGEGATFTVYLPAGAARVAAPVAVEPAAEPDTATGTILVVDDDEIVASVARDILEHAGFTVITAGDGIEALDVVAERGDAIAAVVLDLTMPRMGGEETFRTLRAQRKHLPVILSTGYSEQEAMDRFSGQGLAGFLQKPYRSRTLLACVREGLARRPAAP